MDKKIIYLDYAAATPLDKRANALMADVFSRWFANPSSVHGPGLAAKKILEEARQKIARLLGVKADEVIFTGSGTESVNLAILGVARANKSHGRHIITSQIEHLSVLNACHQLEKEDFRVTYLPVNEKGLVSAEELNKVLAKETILVSVMTANNEIGTVQPIKEISEVIKDWRKKQSSDRPYFHTDACQAAGFLNIRPEALGTDLLSFNGSKIYGPKGAGVLFKKNKVPLESLLFGGSQERGLRAGTESVALAAGMALALELAEKNKKEETVRLTGLRDWLIEKIQREIPETKLNGDAKKRLPNNINISFKGIDGEILMLALSRQGFAVSTGSACTTSETGPSHVISALGVAKNGGNLRITLGKETSKNNLDAFFQVLKKEVKRLRDIA